MLEKICIVDDEIELADTYAAYLGKQYEVKVFNSPQAALAEFERDYVPDLVLTDLKMPGMDGERFIAEAQERGIQQPVIVMSAHAQKEHALRAIEQGVTKFLEKPFDPSVLRDAIAETLDRSAHQGRLRELTQELLSH